MKVGGHPISKMTESGIISRSMNTKLHLRLSLLTLSGLLFFSVSGRAQSILLTADNFALLGGTSISFAGPTTISNGNIGLSPGAESAITGQANLTLTGGSILTTGGTTAQARQDLITAQNTLAGMAFNADLTTQDLVGMTLAPGVYKFDDAAGLTGALTLDAQGKNNVSWVFQIGTSLTTSINSTVTMINMGSNGGNDAGIYWNAGAEIVIGDNNTMIGNLISGTSITFGTADIFNGRALALAGISFDGSTGGTALNVTGGPGGSSYNGYPSAVPEPSTYAALAGLAVLGFVISRRRLGRVAV